MTNFTDFYDTDLIFSLPLQVKVATVNQLLCYMKYDSSRNSPLNYDTLRLTEIILAIDKKQFDDLCVVNRYLGNPRLQLNVLLKHITLINPAFNPYINLLQQLPKKT